MNNPTTRKEAGEEAIREARARENYIPDVLPPVSDPLFSKWDKIVRASPWFKKTD